MTDTVVVTFTISISQLIFTADNLSCKSALYVSKAAKHMLLRGREKPCQAMQPQEVAL
jgi:hypothetical protein